MGLGGGIYSHGPVTLTNDVVARNIAQGAGGVFALESATVTSSLIAENTATLYPGGGIEVGGGGAGLKVVSSAIVANSASAGNGGGIASQSAVTLLNSTLSDNFALQGGGIYSDGTNPVTIAFSTIVANTATASSGKGGGIFLGGSSLSLNCTIVAANVATIGPDISLGAGVKVNILYSLIGDKSGTSLIEAPVGYADSKGNLIGGPVNGVIDPKLSALVDNGGPTPTHSPLAGSPAINAGDPAATAGANSVPLADQRGAVFTRVYGGRIDMGAVEVQPDVLAGDYNLDGVVDAGDYVLWRKAASTTDGFRADGNNDKRVDNADYLIWRANFGRSFFGVAPTKPPAAAVSVSVIPRSVTVPAPAAIVDLAIAVEPAAQEVEAVEGFPLVQSTSAGVHVKRVSWLPTARPVTADLSLLNVRSMERAAPARQETWDDSGGVAALNECELVVENATAALDDAFATLAPLRDL